MILHCPCCHARFPLQAATEDDAGRELLALLAELPAGVSRPLIGYLGLFRSKSRALQWERALRLAQEALALHPEPAVLGAALAETARAILDKRKVQGPRPLGNHNYLKAVLQSGRFDDAATDPTPDPSPRAERGLSETGSRTAAALRELEEARRG